MGITSLFHLIVFTHHIMCFQSSEMSVVFTKNKGGNGREREGWLLSQEEFLENQGWAPHCCCRTSSFLGWDPCGYHNHPAAPSIAQSRVQGNVT